MLHWNGRTYPLEESWCEDAELLDSYKDVKELLDRQQFWHHQDARKFRLTKSEEKAEAAHIQAFLGKVNITGIKGRKKKRDDTSDSRRQPPTKWYWSERHGSEQEVQRICIWPDISEQEEKFPIAVYSDTKSDERWVPLDFEYLMTREAPIGTREEFMFCCNCKGDCSEETCACLQLHRRVNGGTVFDNRLFPDDDKNDGSMEKSILMGCGANCSCSHTCPRRLRNIIAPNRFEIFKRDDYLGFGVRTRTCIDQGQVVFEFVGELKALDDLKGDGHKNYSYALCTPKDEQFLNYMKKITRGVVEEADWDSYVCRDFFIEPYDKGNVARFCSHGCLPNLQPIRFMANDARPHAHHILFAATAPIPAGAELFIDYGPAYFEQRGRGLVCRCNTLLCKERKDPVLNLPMKELVAAVQQHNEQLRQACREHEARMEQLIREERERKEKLEREEKERKEAEEEREIREAEEERERREATPWNDPHTQQYWELRALMPRGAANAAQSTPRLSSNERSTSPSALSDSSIEVLSDDDTNREREPPVVELSDDDDVPVLSCSPGPSEQVVAPPPVEPMVERLSQFSSRSDDCPENPFSRLILPGPAAAPTGPFVGTSFSAVRDASSHVVEARSRSPTPPRSRSSFAWGAGGRGQPDVLTVSDDETEAVAVPDRRRVLDNNQTAGDNQLSLKDRILRDELRAVRRRGVQRRMALKKRLQEEREERERAARQPPANNDDVMIVD